MIVRWRCPKGSDHDGELAHDPDEVDQTFDEMGVRSQLELVAPVGTVERTTVATPGCDVGRYGYPLAMKHVSVAEAKNRLPALLHEASESGPIAIFRYDQPVAVIVAHEEFMRLQRQRRARPGAFAAVMKWRERYRDDLEELDIARALEPKRDQTPARPVKW